MKRIGSKKRKKKITIALTIPLVLFLCLYFLQTYWAHRDGTFVPDYPRIVLDIESDYETFFLQTGLGKAAVDKLIANHDFETIKEIQKRFFAEPEVECKATFGLFTRHDKIASNIAPSFVDVQPGDIILTLSTHSCGWRHGHAGLVLDDESVLECMTLGKDSAIAGIKHWQTYSQFAVLRVKGVTPEQQQDVVAYAKEYLCGVPYRLSAGIIGKKDLEPDDNWFGLQCAYLVWNAWNKFGYDLDSDGGRLVTSHDLMYSDQLEIVQIYGMDPREFCKKTSPFK